MYDVDRKKIVEWVVQQFAANGQRVDRELARSLVDAVVPEGLEPDLHHLANEVAKLATWAGSDPVDWESARELVVPFGEMPSFALTDAIGRRDVAAVLAATEESFERESSPLRDVAPRLVGAVPAPRAPQRVQASPRRRLLEPGGRVPPEAAPVLRVEARAAGGGLHRGRAPRRVGPPRRARPCAQRRLAPAGRSGARAGARRRDARPRGPGGLGALAGDQPRRLRLLARSGVAVQCATGGGAIDPAHELAMLVGDGLAALLRQPSPGAS